MNEAIRVLEERVRTLKLKEQTPEVQIQTIETSNMLVELLKISIEKREDRRIKLITMKDKEQLTSVIANTAIISLDQYNEYQGFEHRLAEKIKEVDSIKESKAIKVYYWHEREDGIDAFGDRTRVTVNKESCSHYEIEEDAMSDALKAADDNVKRLSNNLHEEAKTRKDAIEKECKKRVKPYKTYSIIITIAMAAFLIAQAFR